MTKKRQVQDVLDYGPALEALRERRGLSRESLAERSGVSYSYLSEVERGLKRPSTDVLVKIATALEMLPSDLLRNIEEVSAKGRGLLRRRVYSAMHENAGWQPEPGPAQPAESIVVASMTVQEEMPEAQRLVQELLNIASQLPVEDLEVLLSLARRLRAR